MTTQRQLAAVKFTEVELGIKFNGDIHNHQQVSTFLSKYLQRAKNVYDEREAMCYEALEGYPYSN